MSLYNALHGFEPTAPLVLGILVIHPNDIPRFRDAYVTYLNDTKTAAVMVVLTRTGSFNRETYAEENEALCALPGYLSDADDEFDATFALFRYTLPETYQKTILEHLAENGPPLTLREKTMQAVGPDQTVRQRAASATLAEQIKGALKSVIDKD
jgi:hypothetical protein